MSLDIVNTCLSSTAGTQVIGGPCFWEKKEDVWTGERMMILSLHAATPPLYTESCSSFGVEWLIILHYGF